MRKFIDSNCTYKTLLHSISSMSLHGFVQHNSKPLSPRHHFLASAFNPQGVESNDREFQAKLLLMLLLVPWTNYTIQHQISSFILFYFNQQIYY